eukprot:m.69314 g.69314  ORF g.69314 m.69314 type:complete len:859 (+) comp7544_c0_seq2:591-3167(+)
MQSPMTRGLELRGGAYVTSDAIRLEICKLIGPTYSGHARYVEGLVKLAQVDNDIDDYCIDTLYAATINDITEALSIQKPNTAKALYEKLQAGKQSAAAAASARRPLGAAEVDNTTSQFSDMQISRTPVSIAFGADYIDSFEVLGRFSKRIKAAWSTFCTEWTKGLTSRHLGAYIAVLQSSMFGKSRLLFELGKHNYVIYACIRVTDRQEAYPLADAAARQFFLDKVATSANPQGVCQGYLLAWALEFAQWCDTQGDTPNPADWFCVGRGMHEQIVDVVQKHPEFCEVLPWTADAKLRVAPTVPSSVAKAIQKVRRSVDRVLCQTVTTVLVIALDEAAILVENEVAGRALLVYLRRALTILQAVNLPIFVVLSDTNAHLSNYTPPVSMVPSARSPFIRYDLFPPFTEIVTFDVGASLKGPMFTVSQAIRHPQCDLQVLCSLGRAGLGALLRSGYALADFFPLLQQKLLNSATIDTFYQQAQTMDRVCGSLAVLGSLVALTIHPRVTQAATLVASRMATCVSVSKDRHVLFCTYPSEPAMSIAARRLLAAHTEQILEDLVFILATGLTCAGPTGELVVEVVWQLAIVAALGDGTDLGSAIPLRSVFQQLLDDDTYQTLSRTLDQCTWTPYIDVTRFIPVHYDITHARLAALRDRTAAAQCKECQIGIDHVLPVMWVPADHADLTIITTDLRDQCKLRKDERMSDDAILEGLSRPRCYGRSVADEFDRRVPNLGLHFSLHPNETPSQRVLSQDNLTVVRIGGLETIPCVRANDAVLTSLLRAVEVQVDFRSLVASEEQRDVCPLLPLEFVTEQLGRRRCVALTMKSQQCLRTASDACKKPVAERCCSQHCRHAHPGGCSKE